MPSSSEPAPAALLPLADHRPLVSCAWLAAHLGDPRLCVLDATVHLARPRFDGDYAVASGVEGWRAGHVPGSRHADLVTALSDPTSPWGFSRPAPPVLAAALQGLGVGDGQAVVVYDSDSGIWAARLWWMLRSLGVCAAVLDGGWARWQADGHAVEHGDAAPRRAAERLSVKPRPGLWIDRAGVEAVAAGQRPGSLVCTLGAEVFNAQVPTRYSRRGHIPGSLNLPARGLLADDGCWLPAPALQAAVAPVLDAAPRPWVLYCGAGIAACGAALALTLLGHDDLVVYDGSLQEWSADPALPLSGGG